MKFNAIAKICKYKRFNEGHHFISMAMEVHDALKCDMDLFIKECACFFYDRQVGGHLSLSFCIQFFRQRVSITFQCALASIIERKIALVGDACSRPPITIRSHDLHVGNIKGVVGEITSWLSPLFLVLGGLYVFWPFFGLPFLSRLGGFVHRSFFLEFCKTFVSTNTADVPAFHLKLVTLIEANKLLSFIIEILS